MDSARSNLTSASQSDRLSRYTQRIEQLLNRTKSKSKSPFRCRTPKMNKEGPMVSRIDTYIKYQHSFFVLNKIIQFKAKQLMSDFLIQLKFPSKRHSQSRTPTKFVIIKEPISGKRSHILALRLAGLGKLCLKQSLQNMRTYGQKEQTLRLSTDLREKERRSWRDKSSKTFVKGLVRIASRITKNRWLAGFTALARTVNFRIKATQFTVARISKLLFRTRKETWGSLEKYSKDKLASAKVLRQLVFRYTAAMHKSICKAGRRYSVNCSKRPRQKDLQKIRQLGITNVQGVWAKYRRMHLLSGFFKILGTRKGLSKSMQTSPQKQDNSALNISFRSKSSRASLSPRNRKFPRQCNKFRRMLQIFNTRCLKTYDDVLQTMVERSLESEQFFFSNLLLNKLFLKKAYTLLRQNSQEVTRQRKILQALPKLYRLLQHKKQCTLSNPFWKIFSFAASQYQTQTLVHKCAHALSNTLNKIYRCTLVDGYLMIKRHASENRQFQTACTKEDNASTLIYDDMASFLEQRQGAFEQLRLNYDKLKSMVGLEGVTEINSSSFESIKAIHQIKSRVLSRAN